MYGCERCDNPDCCERLDLPQEPVLCDECYLAALEAEKEKPLTNGDRVRNMADDELAIFMAEQIAKDRFATMQINGIFISEIQKRFLMEQQYFIWIRWLLSPAEEGKE